MSQSHATRRRPTASGIPAHPIVLVAEVSDTYDGDTKRKAKLYARARYPDYLILDLIRDETLVFRLPREDLYTKRSILRPGERYLLPEAGGASIAVADLLES